MKSAPRMPVLFVGHGSPMNAITDNVFTRGFRRIAEAVPRPHAIVAISAHWYVDGTYLTGDAHPRTIHDFGGFPRALYEIEYPARGAPEVAKAIRDRLGGAVALRSDWGLDHGTWSVLEWMYPAADVPVIQLSIDRRLPPARHLEIGRALRPLRDEGVLILGSGNVVHNLRHAIARLNEPGAATPDWARRFDDDLSKMTTARDDRKIEALLADHDDAAMAHPSPDHFFPFLYAYGASDDEDVATFPVDGWDAGSISMRSTMFSAERRT